MTVEENSSPGSGESHPSGLIMNMTKLLDSMMMPIPEEDVRTGKDILIVFSDHQQPKKYRLIRKECVYSSRFLLRGNFSLFLERSPV